MFMKLAPKFLAILALLILALVAAGPPAHVAEAAPPCPPCIIDPPDRPDLRLGTRSAEPNGAQWRVSFTATNGGTRAAGASQAVVKDGATVVRTFNVGALAEGQSRTFAFDYPKTACSISLQVVLDSGHTVAESNESNNSGTISRDTCPPPPGTGTLSVTSSSPVQNPIGVSAPVARSRALAQKK